jgi:hypothetical protein
MSSFSDSQSTIEVPPPTPPPSKARAQSPLPTMLSPQRLSPIPPTSNIIRKPIPVKIYSTQKMINNGYKNFNILKMSPSADNIKLNESRSESRFVSVKPRVRNTTVKFQLPEEEPKTHSEEDLIKNLEQESDLE